MIGRIAFAGRESRHVVAEGLGTSGRDSEEPRRLLVELRADEPAGDAAEVGRLRRPEDLGQPRQAGADVLHGIVALGLGEALGRPIRCWQLRRRGRVEERRQLAGAELQTLLRRQLPVVLEEIARQAVLPVGRLRRADEAEPRIAERHPVLCVPPAQEGARHLARHGADAGARIDPARRHEIHPRLAVALAHELDGHAADAVGEIVIGRAGHRIGHAPETELVEARQELLVVLVAEDAKHPLSGVGRTAARDERQDQAGEVGVVEARCGLHRPRAVSNLSGLVRIGHAGLPAALSRLGLSPVSSSQRTPMQPAICIQVRECTSPLADNAARFYRIEVQRPA